jgi:hypothetical protein
MKLRTLLTVGAIGAASMAATGCTPAQTQAWLSWHGDDPEAAIAFLDTPEGQATLDDTETSTDGPQFAQHLAGSAVVPGDCSSYAGLFAAYGLPVATFTRIAWRESGCNHRSFVSDSDDLGGGLLGLNLRAGASRWRSWCGLTTANVTDAATNVRCAAAAYERMGMRPWG